MVVVSKPEIQKWESWTAVLLAVIPFLLPMLVYLGPLLDRLYAALGLDFTQTKIASSLAAIALALFILGALLVGWLRGFPRWTYPYLGLVVVTSLLLSNSSMPGFWLFGFNYGYDRLGWLAWLPLMVVAGTAIIVLLIRQRGERPFRLLTNIWQDWTLLSFALYGTMILLTFVGLDEIHSPWERPIMALSGLLLALGAGAYMRATTMKGRAIAIFTGFTVAFNVLVGFFTIYWQTNGPAYFTPSSWGKAISNQLTFWFFYAIFLFSPALIGLLQRSTQRLRIA